MATTGITRARRWGLLAVAALAALAACGCRRGKRTEPDAQPGARPIVAEPPERGQGVFRSKVTMAQRLDSANEVAFSPDGRLLAVSGGRGQTVWVWHTENWTEAGHFRLEASISALSFSPDGRLLYAGGGWKEGLLAGFDWAEGKRVRSFEGLTADVRRMTLSADGRRLLTSSLIEDTHTLWDAGSGQKLWGKKGGERDWHAALRPDGKMVALQSGNSMLTLVRADDGATSKEISLGAPIDELAYTRDGKVVALLRQRGATLALVDPETSAVSLSAWASGSSYSNAFALSPDGRLVAVGDDSGNVDVVSVPELKPATRLSISTSKLSHNVDGLAFSPDGGLLAVTNGRRAVHLFDTRTWARRQIHEGHAARITGVSFTDPSTARTVGDDDTLCEWDLATLRPKRQIALPPGCDLLLTNDDGTHGLCDASSVLGPATVRVVELSTGRVAAEVKLDEGHIRRRIVWPRGKYAYLLEREEVKVIEPLKGATIRSLPVETRFSSRLMVVDDRLLVFSGLPSKTPDRIRLDEISLSDGGKRSAGPTHEPLWVSQIGMVPGNAHLWFAGRGFWVVRRDTLEVVLKLDIEAKHASFDSQGRRFAVVPEVKQDALGEVRLYDWPSGRELGRIASADFRYAQIHFTPDDQRLLVVREDGVLESHPLDPLR